MQIIIFKLNACKVILYNLGDRKYIFGQERIDKANQSNKNMKLSKVNPALLNEGLDKKFVTHIVVSGVLTS